MSAQPRARRAEQAYRHVLDEIVRGRWQEGDTLSTYALAEELKISRTPVLEALKRLEGDGMVEIIPQVGCRIVRPSTDAVEELYAVRAALEGLAAAAAARRIGDDALARLEVTMRAVDEASARGDRAAYGELDERFHLAIVEAAGMPRLADTAGAVMRRLRHQLARLPAPDEQLREAVSEHHDLYEALRRRTPRRARAAAERHVTLTAARFAAALGPDRQDGMVHGALIYGNEAEFLAATVPFIEAGLDADERVLAVTTTANAEALTRMLGPRAGEVEFRDSYEWYELPSHTLLSYDRYVEEADRSRVRIVGEVAWDGDLGAPMSEWKRYEAIINVAFALRPVSFICPYDVRRLPDGIVADARRTHPQLYSGSEMAPSADFTEARAFVGELDREPLPAPHAPTTEIAITGDLHAARGFILDRARRAGVTGKVKQDAFLAVQEVAANVIAHGAGHGTLRSWVTGGRLVYEVSDEGVGTGDPLISQLTADPMFSSEPRGLWMARLLCDLVEVRAHDRGLVVRLHVALR